MKNVIILGASGSLAEYVIQELEKVKDVNLTLFVRNTNRLRKNTAAVVVNGDVMDYGKLKDAINGKDIVYVNLAGDLQSMAKNIVKAMKETGVNRIIAISSIGIYDDPVKSILIPYRKLADVIEASGLDYTILRPDWFTSANEIDYAITYKGEPETGNAVSRKSIASFVASIIENPERYKNANVGVSKP
jgi:uncharacterized protein YbjT (DUF2867 family)